MNIITGKYHRLSQGRTVMNMSARIRVLLAVMASVLLSARPVYAEDIEIYLVPGAEGGGANILLLIDTSGGTNRNFPGEADPNADGKKTIDQIAYALQMVVDGLAGSTRVGIASQQSSKFDGGAINYPVKQIDEKAEPSALGFVSGAESDAHQVVSGGSWKPIDVKSEILPLPPRRVGADEPQRVGFIINSVAVPRYAKIDKAILSIASPDGGAGGFKMAMAYEQQSAPALFSDAADLSDYAGAGTFGRVWSALQGVEATLSSGVITADVTALVQSAVAETFWCGSVPLALMIDETSISTPPSIYSLRAENALGQRLGAITLDIDWSSSSTVAPPATASGDDLLSCMGGVNVALTSGADDGRESATGTSNISIDENSILLQNVTSGAASSRGDFIGGVRFAALPFGPDTKVKKAELTLRVTNRVGTTPQMVVRPMLGNTPAFGAEGSIRGRPTGTSTGPVPALIGANAVDVTTQVKEVFGGTWAAGNSLGFRIERHTSGTTSLTLAAVEGGATGAASLRMDLLSAKATDFVGVISRRDEMKKEIRKFSNATGGGNNMPATSYLESALYMLGRKPVFDAGNGHPEAFVSPPSRDLYDTPVAGDFECGGNHIILVTHAEPSGDKPAAPMNSLTGDGSCPSDNNKDGWTCMAGLAKFLQDATRNGLNIPITSHTVAFAPQQESTYLGLADVAKNGGGMAETAETAVELAEVLSKIIDSLTTTEGSMAAPGVAVNQLNRFRHLDQLYYALFRPELNTRWDGNLKRYRLDFSSQKIVDEKGREAVDPQTGFFRDSSNSWWGLRADGTDPDDGGKVNLGGAREELELSTKPRNLLISSSSPTPSGSTTSTSKVAGVTLTHIDDFGVTGADMGMSTEDATEVKQRLQLVRETWGDPLHSEPRLVNFGFSGSAEEASLDDSKQDNTVFVTTNGGMMHAIDPKTGEELFAFMPREELKKTELRFQNEPLVAADPQRSTYGLDGGITVWRRGSADGSGKPEHVFLYLGQRRGGNAYYAMDVSDRSNPKLMWKIQGGAAPFGKLGQTWSQPTLAQIEMSGQRVPVLVFGGGYSATNHDTAGVVSGGDATGNAIYMVNAYNGQLIWSASNAGATVNNADMRWSIPASVSVVDVDFDGVIDHIYAADLGGQIFRVDINPEATSAANLATRMVTLAKLGTSEAGGITNHRRFHASPVVALGERGGELILQVILGSGYRSHPLNMDTQDYIFLVDDVDVLKGTSSGTVTRADMLDVTTDLSPDPAILNSKRGWYIILEKGEKVLSSAVVSNGVVFISTYLPESAFINKCQRVVGSSRLYAMNLTDGSPALDLDNSGFLNRSTDLILPGLPPSPQLLLDGTGEQVLLIGTTALSGGSVSRGKGVRKTRWYEVPNAAEAERVINEALEAVTEEEPTQP
jgi:type IV pilus assembly protein PilY1